MPAYTLVFLVIQINASDRHLNFLYIDISPSRLPWLWIYIYIFLTISDNQLDGQNNESEVEVNAVGDPVQNTAQISKLIYRYNKLSVCLWVDTKMLVRCILTFVLIIFLCESCQRHSLIIPIMCIGHCTCCGITVEGGNVCEICSQPSTNGDALAAQNETPKGMYY